MDPTLGAIATPRKALELEAAIGNRKYATIRPQDVQGIYVEEISQRKQVAIVPQTSLTSMGKSKPDRGRHFPTQRMCTQEPLRITPGRSGDPL